MILYTVHIFFIKVIKFDLKFVLYWTDKNQNKIHLTMFGLGASQNEISMLINGRTNKNFPLFFQFMDFVKEGIKIYVYAYIYAYIYISEAL